MHSSRHRVSAAREEIFPHRYAFLLLDRADGALLTYAMVLCQFRTVGDVRIYLRSLVDPHNPDCAIKMTFITDDEDVFDYKDGDPVNPWDEFTVLSSALVRACPHAANDPPPLPHLIPQVLDYEIIPPILMNVPPPLPLPPYSPPPSPPLPPPSSPPPSPPPPPPSSPPPSAPPPPPSSPPSSPPPLPPSSPPPSPPPPPPSSPPPSPTPPPPPLSSSSSLPPNRPPPPPPWPPPFPSLVKGYFLARDASLERFFEQVGTTFLEVIRYWQSLPWEDFKSGTGTRLPSRPSDLVRFCGLF